MGKNSSLDTHISGTKIKLKNTEYKGCFFKFQSIKMFSLDCFAARAFQF